MWGLFNYLFANHPELEHYNCSYIQWLNRPLNNPIASSAGAKHSMINIKFTHYRKKNDKIEFCVERLADGIYQSDFIPRRHLVGMCGKIHSAVRSKYFLKRINLKQFLIECNTQNDTKYAVGRADCHCFAKYIWDLCTTKNRIRKPNAYLVVIAKTANYKLDSKTKNIQRDLTEITSLDPRNNETNTILQLLVP